jgi:hypothetical protein
MMNRNSIPIPEPIARLQRQMDQFRSTQLACKEAEIVEQTFYQRRKEYGGLQLEPARKLKDLQKRDALHVQPTRTIRPDRHLPL